MMTNVFILLHLYIKVLNRNGFRLLADTDTYLTIEYSFRIDSSTVVQFVAEVCDAICKRIQEQFMSQPSEENRTWSVRMYDTLWKFTNCIGSIDWKHVTIKCADNSEPKYLCYLKKFCTVLLAIIRGYFKFYIHRKKIL